MNRLVILGNGFDLAHGLPTRYDDFMLWYLKDVFKKKHDASGLISITKTRYFQDNWEESIDEINNIKELFDFLDLKGQIAPYKFESQLLSDLLDVQKIYNWVDIEAKYYERLTKALNSKNPQFLKTKIQLNNDFEKLKILLEKYLLEEVERKYNFRSITGFLDIFTTKKYTIEKSSGYLLSNEYPEKTVFLNFNYTPLIEYYFTQPEIIHNLKNYEVNYIHGELESIENPIIFGFGDEMDKSYQEIEELNNNAYFEHIKSFQYLKTSNYQDLVRFLDGSTEGYEIFIIGHSCGLSDRTLLNHVFEHDNCKSIKIFYHNGIKGYTNTTYEISRHFNDKANMRNIIVPFDKSLPTPKVQLDTIK